MKCVGYLGALGVRRLENPLHKQAIARRSLFAHTVGIIVGHV
jgi:hypothetical protein